MKTKKVVKKLEEYAKLLQSNAEGYGWQTDIMHANICLLASKKLKKYEKLEKKYEKLKKKYKQLP